MKRKNGRSSIVPGFSRLARTNEDEFLSRVRARERMRKGTWGERNESSETTNERQQREIYIYNIYNIYIVYA